MRKGKEQIIVIIVLSQNENVWIEKKDGPCLKNLLCRQF